MAMNGVDPAHQKRRMLGGKLRALRVAAGLTGREIATYIDASQSTVSRVEIGSTLPAPSEIIAWAKATGASMETQELLQMRKDAVFAELGTSQAALQGFQDIPDEVRERLGTALQIYSYHPGGIPAAFQTPDYAQRTLEAAPSPASESDVGVADKLARLMDEQLGIYEGGKALELIITEGALSRYPGRPRSLAAQLDRIAAMSTVDGVSIGIVPSLVNSPTFVPTSFEIYDLNDSTTVVMVPTIHSLLLVQDSDDVALYRSYWEAVRQVAYFGDDARGFIYELAAIVREIDAE